MDLKEAAETVKIPGPVSSSLATLESGVPKAEEMLGHQGTECVLGRDEEPIRTSKVRRKGALMMGDKGKGKEASAVELRASPNVTRARAMPTSHKAAQTAGRPRRSCTARASPTSHKILQFSLRVGNVGELGKDTAQTTTRSKTTSTERLPATRREVARTTTQDAKRVTLRASRASANRLGRSPTARVASSPEDFARTSRRDGEVGKSRQSEEGERTRSQVGKTGIATARAGKVGSVQRLPVVLETVRTAPWSEMSDNTGASRTFQEDSGGVRKSRSAPVMVRQSILERNLESLIQIRKYRESWSPQKRSRSTTTTSEESASAKEEGEEAWTGKATPRKNTLSAKESAKDTSASTEFPSFSEDSLSTGMSGDSCAVLEERSRMRVVKSQLTRRPSTKLGGDSAGGQRAGKYNVKSERTPRVLTPTPPHDSDQLMYRGLRTQVQSGRSLRKSASAALVQESSTSEWKLLESATEEGAGEASATTLMKRERKRKVKKGKKVKEGAREAALKVELSNAQSSTMQERKRLKENEPNGEEVELRGTTIMKALEESRPERRQTAGTCLWSAWALAGAGVPPRVTQVVQRASKMADAWRARRESIEERLQSPRLSPNYLEGHPLSERRRTTREARRRRKLEEKATRRKAEKDAKEERLKEKRMDHLSQEVDLCKRQMKTLMPYLKKKMLALKMPEIKREVEHKWHRLENVLDFKDHIIQEILEKIDQKNDIGFMIFQERVQSIDEMLATMERRAKKLHEHFKMSMAKMVGDHKEKMKMLELRRQNGNTHLKMLMDLSIEESERFSENVRVKVKEFTLEEETKGSKEFKEEKERLYLEIEKLYNNIHTELDNYNKRTSKTSDSVEALKKKEEEFEMEFADDEGHIQELMLDEEILTKKLEKITRRKEEILSFMNEKYDIYKSWHKVAMKKYFMKADDDKKILRHLVLTSRETIEWLQARVKKGNQLLSLGNICRKLETEEEQQFGLHTKDETCITANGEDEVIDLISDLTGTDISKLRFFWSRVSKATMLKGMLKLQVKTFKENNTMLVSSILKKPIGGLATDYVIRSPIRKSETYKLVQVEGRPEEIIYDTHLTKNFKDIREIAISSLLYVQSN